MGIALRDVTSADRLISTRLRRFTLTEFTFVTAQPCRLSEALRWLGHRSYFASRGATPALPFCQLSHFHEFHLVSHTLSHRFSFHTHAFARLTFGPVAVSPFVPLTHLLSFSFTYTFAAKRFLGSQRFPS